ncbi:alpha/beta fold hydrolase, partial [Rhodococcus sp. CX]|uniref:alpha/beta fold hydrolase n=1 Tax=Rhodococcus sp. CX TaxID=2789880 RepID=UPI001E594A68
RRWFTGEFTPREYYPIFARIGRAYFHHYSLGVLARELAAGAWRSRPRPEPLIFAGRHLMKGWSGLDRLGEIRVPTLVLGGRDDFVFPPACQHELATGIPGSTLRIIEHAGHNPHDEQPAQVVQAIDDFLGAHAPT